MNPKRRICVVTGSRAEYGLLYYILSALQSAPDAELQLVVTGMHLSPEFGETWRVIEADGFRIDARVEMLLSGDSPEAITKSCGLGMIGFSDAFSRLQPDIVVVLGDRFEILAAAAAAMFARIPIGHIHGGESTEGLVDEAIRHAVTKMSHLHFTAAEPYRARVIQLGESPACVFNVGAPGLDALTRTEFMSRAELAADLGVELGQPLFAVTYHPVTLHSTSPAGPLGELFQALDEFPEATVILTSPNADTDGRIIISSLEEFARVRPAKRKVTVSLGQRRYLSLLRECDAVIGNSSSGLTEAPALKRATVNIGDRQFGRLKATSVIDCAEQAEEIAAAIHRALSGEFRQALEETASLYGHGGASAKIAQVLRTAPLEGLILKRFHTP